MSIENYPDARLPAAERAELLLRRMTLAEKCGQLTSVVPWVLIRGDGTDADRGPQVLADPPGHVGGPLAVDDPAQLARLVGAIQQRFVTGTRLGIPALIHAEALNGFVAGGHVVFPTAIGLAATWSPDLVQEMANLIRHQMRRVGFGQALAPVMDIAIDPRWGRVHETYGEDPYLAAAFGVAYTRGMQGSNPATGVIATAKHFLGYSLGLGGINRSAFEAGSRFTRDVVAFPFEAAIQLTGLRSVMNSYSDVDGVPAGISREVLIDLLRDTLGFAGFVSSDYTTLRQVVRRQRAASSPQEAARLGVRAGLDVELPDPYAYGAVLAGEVERGNVAVEEVEACVRRVLEAKFALGLFENPYPAEHIDVAAVAEEGRELAAELARRSIVLVRNDGLLPLTPQSVSVAVIGPHADAARLQFPPYTYPAWREMTNAMARGELSNMVGVNPELATWNATMLPDVPQETFVRDRYGARSLADEICDVAGSMRSEAGCTLTRQLDEPALGRAADAARDADVVVLALGGAGLLFNGERTEGEGSDTADIALPGAQAALAETVAATGTPLVVVLFQGRPYTLPEVVRNAAAILVAPYGGPSGPRAVADVLFGAVNPAGKLPYSIPRHTGQIPVYHHQKAGSGYRTPLPLGAGHHYLDLPATPLYPFGHGLSYTDFALSDVACDRQIDTGGATDIAATVTNTGTVDGAAVVQLYIRVNSSGVTRPAQQLAGFGRVELAAGCSARVTFRLAAAQLGCTNSAGEFAVEPAEAEFFLGFDSDDRLLIGAFQVTGPSRVLTSADRSFLSTAAFRPV